MIAPVKLKPLVWHPHIAPVEMPDASPEQLEAMIMEKLDYPSAPIILGVILGPIAESQLMLALTISGGNPWALFGSVMSKIMIALTIFILLTPAWNWWKDRRQATGAA